MERSLLDEHEARERLLERERAARAREELRLAEAREREQEAARAREQLFQWGPGSQDRCRERVALQERHTAALTPLEVEEAAAIRAAQLRANEQVAEIRAEFQQRRAVIAQAHAEEYASLLLDQRERFDPAVAQWVLHRGSEKERLRNSKEIGSDRERELQLREWEKRNPRPGGKR